jgi:hypothetical protein
MIKTAATGMVKLVSAISQLDQLLPIGPVLNLSTLSCSSTQQH